MSKLILITGGARSGKSAYALELAESLGSKRLFVATCPSIDPEMDDRIRRHKEERKGRGWDSVEHELELAELLIDHSDSYDVILIDCVTLWVNNLMFAHEQQGGGINDQIVRDLCVDWLAKARKTTKTVIIVTNEVGLGIVPENKLARLYRDLVGTANQTIGKAADEVVSVTCGIPHYIKK